MKEYSDRARATLAFDNILYSLILIFIEWFNKYISNFSYLSKLKITA